MGPVLGLVAFHVLLALSGGAALFALGMVRLDARSLAFAFAPAYLAGIAVVGPILVALLVVGVPLTLLTFLLVVAVSTGALLGLSRFRRLREAPAASPRARSPFEVWARRLALGGIAAYFLISIPAFANLPTFWDDAHIWSFKALTIYHHDSLESSVFLNPELWEGWNLHLDYPILQPVLEAVTYELMGGEDLQLIHVELWLVLGATAWTAAWLLAPARRILAWLPAVLVLALTRATLTPTELGNADVTVACFVGLGVLCLGMWLNRGRTAHLLLGGLLLGAGANIKNEGFIAALLAVGVAGVVAVAAGRSMPFARGRLDGLRLWLPGAAIAILSILPWRLWVSLNDLKSRDIVPLSESLDPSFLVDGADRLNLGAQAVMRQITDIDRFHLLVPLLLVLAGLCLFLRHASRAAAYYLGTGAVTTVSFMWVYWTSSYVDVNQHINDSVDRVVVTVAFVAAVGVAHLLASLGDRAEDPTGDTIDPPSGQEPATRT